MAVRAIDRIGQKYGMLIINSIFRKEGTRQSYAKCTCECGNGKDVNVASLANGNTRSCGCLQPKVAAALLTKHGMYKSKAYGVWRAMQQRCLNKNHISYKNYGGRGINIEWADFDQFYADMGDPPKGLTIERIDNDLGYSKENCKWATWKEQRANCRMRSDNTSGVVGVHRHGEKFRARLRNTHLGLFPTLEEASLAVADFRRVLASP